MSNVDIYTILSSKPHTAHYLRRYYNFILTYSQANSLQTKEELGYTEKHHICPKAKDLFPEYASFIDQPWNKAILTARQHYVAHWMLWKAYGGSQCKAFYLMSNKEKTGINSNMYSRLKDDHNKFLTDTSIYYNESGEKVRVSIHCDEVKNGIYKSMYKDTITCFDKYGNLNRYNTNDDRIASGEIIVFSKGYSLYKDNLGHTIRAKIDDPRIQTGEIIHYSKGTKRSTEQIKQMSERSKAQKRDPNVYENIKRNIKLKKLQEQQISKFLNKKTNEIVECKRIVLEEKIGFSLEKLFRSKNPRKSDRGWVLLAETCN